MNDKLKAIILCLLVIAALIAASAFVPVDSQSVDNPYPQPDTLEPYHPQAYPEPETAVPTKEPREKKPESTSLPVVVPCECGPEDSIPIVGTESGEICWCWAY